jgi:hypothetical protein
MVLAGSCACAIYYELATHACEGDTRHKLFALNLYWTASLYAQTAQMLARTTAAR